MKSKILYSFMLISIMATGCNQSGDIKYTLKDTWGEDGNWGNQKTVKVASQENVKQPVKAQNTAPTKTVTKSTPTQTSKTPVKTSQPQEKNEVSKPQVAVNDNPKWEKIPNTGMLKANYIKSIPDDNLSFSYSVINNAKLDNKFKIEYKTRLKKVMNGINIVSEKEENVNKNKAWTLAFTYEKEGTKVKQKQVFIPVSKNIMIANFIASEEGFSRVEDEFKTITKNLKL